MSTHPLPRPSILPVMESHPHSQSWSRPFTNPHNNGPAIQTMVQPAIHTMARPFIRSPIDRSTHSSGPPTIHQVIFTRKSPLIQCDRGPGPSYKYFYPGTT